MAARLLDELIEIDANDCNGIKTHIMHLALKEKSIYCIGGYLRRLSSSLTTPTGITLTLLPCFKYKPQAQFLNHSGHFEILDDGISEVKRRYNIDGYPKKYWTTPPRERKENINERKYHGWRNIAYGFEWIDSTSNMIVTWTITPWIHSLESFKNNESIVVKPQQVIGLICSDDTGILTEDLKQNEDGKREDELGDGDRGCYVGMTLAIHNTGEIWYNDKRILEPDLGRAFTGIKSNADLILDLREGKIKYFTWCSWGVNDVIDLVDNVKRGKDIKYKFAAKMLTPDSGVTIVSFKIE